MEDDKGAGKGCTHALVLVRQPGTGQRGVIEFIYLLHVPVQHPCYNFTKVAIVTTSHQQSPSPTVMGPVGVLQQIPPLA